MSSELEKQLAIQSQKITELTELVGRFICHSLDQNDPNITKQDITAIYNGNLAYPNFDNTTQTTITLAS